MKWIAVITVLTFPVSGMACSGEEKTSAETRIPPPPTSVDIDPKSTHFAAVVEGPKGVGPDAEVAVREAALRAMLQDKRLTRLFAGEPVYVAFIQSSDNWGDPPARFLDRFSEYPVELRPVSESDNWKRVPVIWLRVFWFNETDARVHGRALVAFAGSGYYCDAKWWKGRWGIIRPDVISAVN
jgi:hypothetical protein